MVVSLNFVYKVTSTQETGVYVINCNVTDTNGEKFDAVSTVRPEDPYGLTPTLLQWMAENPSFPIDPYQSPTVEQIREAMPSLSARQLRLGLLGNGFTLPQVAAVIEAMPDGPDKDTAQIEWEYATTFNRTHPLIAAVGGSLGLSDEQIDEMWAAAADL
jgi:hypothetical protein